MSDETTIAIAEPISPAATTLDEVALRKPDFRGGHPIDFVGLTLYFPKPSIEYRTKFRAGRVVSSVPETDLGDAFNEAMSQMDSDESEDDQSASGLSFIEKMVQVAAAGLLVNYDLDDETLGRLLVFKSGDDKNSDLWTALVGTARGTYAPKAQSGISESVS